MFENSVLVYCVEHNITGFLLKGYQLTCQLSTQVYAKHLADQPRSLDEFGAYTTDVFFGANCTIPDEIVQMLWKAHAKTHEDFHPHVVGLAPIMRYYLQTNPATSHLDIDLDELTGVIRSLDLDILTARLDNDPQWGTPLYYNKLRKMFLGYLLTCA